MLYRTFSSAAGPSRSRPLALRPRLATGLPFSGTSLIGRNWSLLLRRNYRRRRAAPAGLLTEDCRRPPRRRRRAGPGARRSSRPARLVGTAEPPVVKATSSDARDQPLAIEPGRHAPPAEQEGAAVVEQTREAFERIGSSVDDMAARVEQIAAASQLVAASASKMQESISEIAAVADNPRPPPRRCPPPPSRPRHPRSRSPPQPTNSPAPPRHSSSSSPSSASRRSAAPVSALASAGTRPRPSSRIARVAVWIADSDAVGVQVETACDGPLTSSRGPISPSGCSRSAGLPSLADARTIGQEFVRRRVRRASAAGFRSAERRGASCPPTQSDYSLISYRMNPRYSPTGHTGGTPWRWSRASTSRPSRSPAHAPIARRPRSAPR